MLYFVRNASVLKFSLTFTFLQDISTQISNGICNPYNPCKLVQTKEYLSIQIVWYNWSNQNDVFMHNIWNIISEKPVVQISIGKQRVIKGSNQILSCSVFGKQQPTTLSWKKRVKGVETPIDLAETKYSGGTVDCPSLTINGIDMSDEGTYICKAKNEAGEGCSKELHLSCIGQYLHLLAIF